jgi:hypothetical protein
MTAKEHVMTLSELEALVARWRDGFRYDDGSMAHAANGCADELEAALRQQASAPVASAQGDLAATMGEYESRIAHKAGVEASKRYAEQIRNLEKRAQKAEDQAGKARCERDDATYMLTRALPSLESVARDLENIHGIRDKAQAMNVAGYLRERIAGRAGTKPTTPAGVALQGRTHQLEEQREALETALAAAERDLAAERAAHEAVKKHLADERRLGRELNGHATKLARELSTEAETHAVLKKHFTASERERSEAGGKYHAERSAHEAAQQALAAAEKRAAELERERDEAQSLARAYKRDIDAETEGALALRKELGARDDEGFPGFVRRLATERDTLRAELAKVREELGVSIQHEANVRAAWKGADERFLAAEAELAACKAKLEGLRLMLQVNDDGDRTPGKLTGFMNFYPAGYGARVQREASEFFAALDATKPAEGPKAGDAKEPDPFGPAQTFNPKCAVCNEVQAEHHYNGACYGKCGKFVSKFPAKPAEPSPVEPDPDAPKDVKALPAYWDARRKAQGKPDLSRCGAELRAALGAEPSPVDVEALARRVANLEAVVAAASRHALAGDMVTWWRVVGAQAHLAALDGEVE